MVSYIPPCSLTQALYYITHCEKNIGLVPWELAKERIVPLRLPPKEPKPIGNNLVAAHNYHPKWLTRWQFPTLPYISLANDLNV